MSGPWSAAGLCVVSASAGTGKTTRLTREVCESLDPSTSTSISVPGLFAVTYTTKAQSELESRLRQTLVERGELDRAEQLPLAHLGTVHAVCLRLLQEFSLEAGLSPGLVGMPAEAARHCLQQALEHGLAEGLRERLRQCSDALELRWDARVDRHDWISPVEQIMTLARNNRIAPERLAVMAERSWTGFSELLGPAVPNGEALERALEREALEAIAKLEGLNSNRQNTASTIRELREALEDLERGRLRWSRWQKLANLEPEVAARPLVEAVRAAAEQYLVHPRFQSDVRELTHALFEAAEVGLDAYARFKAERGLVDYVDMIDLALNALDAPAVYTSVAERIELSVVDEFQDTSPVQLELFSRLHLLCNRTFWVGDQKQCIFEYAGADPALMDAVHGWVVEQGGRTEVLETNHRSRPELVRAVSELFSGAFASHGLDPEQVRCVAGRKSNAALDALPAIGVFQVSSKRGAELPAVARGVARLLAAPDTTPVLDRRTGAVRPVRPSDIAVLVASNREAEQLAGFLAGLGVRSVLPRTGLMRTPEATLLRAALRLVLDPRDSLAEAELEALHGFEGRTPAEWFEARLRTLARGADQEPASGRRERGWLESIRSALRTLAPLEVVKRLIGALDLATLARRWPDPDQRLGNIDALEALVVAYENRCVYLREAASIAGLLRYFAEAEIPVRQQDEERASDEQYVGASDEAVVLSTYHKAKGLEWPVVVLASLDKPRRRSAFEVAPETDRERFDPSDPLGGRWIRYWPWPLGQVQKAPLRDRAERSGVGRGVTRRDARERARLLYVGFTRARDHLVLSVPVDAKGKTHTEWLDELRDERGPLLELPSSGTDGAVKIRTRTGQSSHHPARIWSSSEQGDEETSRVEKVSIPIRWFQRSTEAVARRPYRIVPSGASESSLEIPRAKVVGQVRLARRLPIHRPPTIAWDAVGTALHRFLAVDRPDVGDSRRQALAIRVLEQAGLSGSFDSASLVAASDALRAFCDERWPSAVWIPELSISAVLDAAGGARRIDGSIDLLLRTERGVIIIDHKSFPGASDAWAERALGYAAQLFTYEHALVVAGEVVLGRFVHFTVGGGMVEVAPA